ncbi:hypothetical protein DPMN_008764 [Dreissena polymorpha]|uniref:Tyrosinase copper-binding domain-containing protein n=1 Tax=Dreissena polymorpha TaxID=45954 RepID=A0A9D4MVV8_DREPO|nr:hypothetical protein DPMN_008764 [Dreissena polymorpha]
MTCFVVNYIVRIPQSLRPNVYDALAAFDQGANVQRAHFGPAFTGWHRLYLWM